ncbi:Dyp-type peroxidase [Corynebacterium guangdongense]|uniref:Deferrochelatase/peroxidase EfeB n=1 Tax=Corynebacterium guangdongense TaxID=1783348 RepID=A0ABU1ZWK9_9CORY|nr:Dyp-type peroxidase [Corynebacterium guangdongense]MDR7328617.1 deferrochelatase/peroxidase EfeB [Corynebacterium guangdongense]WJZ17194.1 putative deferrochelatase/peroxidase EfeN precursor [Corynebacterium guangdongense]
MKLNRRQFFGGAAAVGGAGLIGGCARPTPTPAEPGDLMYPFEGEHQAGIVTPAQDTLHFAAFDLDESATGEDLAKLMQRWSDAARRLVVGGEMSARGAFGGGPNFPPDDSGDAFDLGPHGLTVTFGFGRSLFVGGDGRTDRFGLAGRMPRDFEDMSVMVNDFIVPERSHGDLCIQACANDPLVSTHAIRNLTRLAVPDAVLRWSQRGFGRSSSTSTSQQTPRNLFGQKDGTNNLKAEQPQLLDDHVWIPATGNPASDWAVGGSYLTARRIAMSVEIWDSLQLSEQERVTGRAKASGAPLSGGGEFDAPDFTAVNERGRPLIDAESHVARVHPDHNGGIRMLRRGYDYIDGNDDQGRLDAGLFFMAYTKSPGRVAAVHRNMARDAMFTEYLKTTNTGVYLIPPGVGGEGFIGEGLLRA